MSRLLAILADWFERCFPKKSLGELGERAAARHLKRHGYKIVATHKRLRPGELDIVAIDGGTVVFIEVKTRRNQQYGHPAEAVTPAKQRQLTRLAVTYLKLHGLLEHAARFDVVAVTWPENHRRPEIEHFKNAFDAVGEGEFYS